MAWKKRPQRTATTCTLPRWRAALLVLIGAATAIAVTAASAPTAHAKSPGSRYCFHGYCHRVGTLAQTDSLVGWRGYVIASYYDSCQRDPLNPCGLTSSGAVFRADLPDNAASPLLPDGTVILAYNPKTGDASVLRITNAGPYSGERKLDVSRAAAEKLGFRRQGVAGLVISVLQSPTKAEASYARKRVYPIVPGYLGRFATVDIALDAARTRFGIREEAEQLIANIEAPFKTSLDAGIVPKPQLAVSPSLARELVMLRLPPRPVSREPQLLQGPRAMTKAEFMNQQAHASADADPQP